MSCNGLSEVKWTTFKLVLQHEENQINSILPAQTQEDHLPQTQGDHLPQVIKDQSLGKNRGEVHLSWLLLHTVLSTDQKSKWTWLLHSWVNSKQSGNTGIRPENSANKDIREEEGGKAQGGEKNTWGQEHGISGKRKRVCDFIPKKWGLLEGGVWKDSNCKTKEGKWE